MKISNKEKIDEYFSDIRNETIFQALKSQKYTGIKRAEISRLLEKYTLNQVFTYLKTRYRKINYLLIYSLSFVVLLLLLFGNYAYSYFYMDTDSVLNHLSIKNFSELGNQDYFVSILLIVMFVNFILVIKEIFNKFKRL